MLKTVIAPDILLPKDDINLSKWAVIACDQFTGRLNYWEGLRSFVQDSPSTLHLTLPEIYLAADNCESIKNINNYMKDYLNKNIFKTLKDTIVLIDRRTSYKNQRLGLVLAVDLEDYSYKPLDKALIRATEGTILERIPPRVKIRENAPIELSHIMLLIDDRKDFIIEKLYEDKDKLEKIYDFELNTNGGTICGYKVKDNLGLILQFEKLLEEQKLIEKYGTNDKMLFAVGDGNHSLATAKTCWENIKKNLTDKEKENHPARFALCEVVNIHSKGLKFEPIHRLIKNADNDKLFKNISFEFSKFENPAEVFIGKDSRTINLPSNTAESYLAVQNFIDKFIKENGGEVDYIHGRDELKDICENENGFGIVMPKLKKDELFSYIIKYGPLPRKTFSMGEALEKRYYLEARKISL